MTWKPRALPRIRLERDRIETQAAQLRARREAALARWLPLGRPVRVALIGCGAEKREGRHPARELYTGNLFRAALAHAEPSSDVVFVLSAKHGLVALDDEIESYDLRLTDLPPRLRSEWAVSVIFALGQFPAPIELDITAYAGAAYLNEFQWSIELPLRGRLERWTLTDPLHALQIGERLSWFRQRRTRR